ncbi:tetratricopeptide repeat protein [Kaistella sp. G5-32]|uniref:Tetratricopeptide repeat protein n=1 Tax=Kaistella gelatinilytica TaxID=2787636 RepID=A0ABS0F7L0_9FLAO|nr:tetratricopeptide repeat protein [Kaistella gelatinilytica]MBF8455697.1 tetratricopeptide repeat protein [Kaistella gelatinilytica]
MRIKYFFSLFLILSTLFFRAQTIQLNSAENNIAEWERILSPKNNLVRDTTAFKNFLEPLRKRNSQSDKVLYNLLLANVHAKAYDRINSVSNRYYSRSIANAKKLDNKALEIWATLCYAEYFYNYRQVTEALPYFVAAIEKINQSDPAQILFPSESFTKIGFYLGTIGDNREAINYLKKALKYTNKNTAEFAKISDNLGAYYLELGDVVNARKNIEIASEVAKSVGDSVRYAKTLGNFGIIYERNHDYANAIKLLLQDIQISERFKAQQNTMFAYTVLARLYIANNQISEADSALKKADLIAKSKSYFKINELEILKLKLEIIYNQKTGGELAVRRRIGVLEDSLNKTDGIMPLNQANWMMQKRNYQQNIASTESELSKQSFIKNLIFVASGLLILLILFIIFNAKSREKLRQIQNDNKIKEYEKTKASNERKLAFASKTLDSQIDFLKEKNIQIQKLHLEIDKIKKSEVFSDDQDQRKLDNLLQSHLMTEENWRNFKNEFQREHSGFYDHLIQNFPEITDSNLRIILLQKLGFTNTEISGLLGITVDAVKKSKQRLKRKLGDKYDLLFQMIAVEN